MDLCHIGPRWNDIGTTGKVGNRVRRSNILQRRLSSLPRIGQRMLKTAAAVFLCLAFYCLRGYRGEDMPTEAAVTAIICMQPYVRDSREYALNRMTGTLIGAFWGLLFLLALLAVPVMNLYLVYAFMAVGVLASLYTTVLFRKPDASSLAAIVFICVVISFPEIENPLLDALERVLGVLVGTAVAVGINVFHLPRVRRRNRVFFLRTADLVPDRFAQISPAVLFRLNSLLQDGASLCLVSRHAPAFFTSQLSAVRQTLPMIIMDGAALYDANENHYLSVEAIRERDSAYLLETLDHMGLSCFLYTVHRNRTCIFHRGDLRPQERDVLNLLRRSPYRSYLDEENYAAREIVCVKIIGTDAEVTAWKRHLHTLVHARRMRMAVQPQAGAEGVSGLYIYSNRATVRRAQNQLMDLIRIDTPDAEAEEIFLSRGYRSEHDAMVLLSRLYHRYAPMWLLAALHLDR